MHTDDVFRSFVDFLEGVDARGQGGEFVALELIDDILSSGLSDSEARGMIYAVTHAARYQDLDANARAELVKTRDYLKG